MRARMLVAVAAKELRTALRGDRLAFMLCTTAIGAATLMYLSLADGSPSWERTHGPEKALIYGMVLMLTVGAAVSGALGIAFERAQRTYHLLRATALDAGTIVAGKLAAVALLALIALSWLVPTGVAVALACGGMSTAQMLQVALASFAGALLAGSAGLAASAVSQRPQEAQGVMFGAGFLIAVLSTGQLLVAPFTQNPFLGLRSALDPHAFVPGCPWPTWAVGAGLSLLGTVFFVLRARHALMQAGADVAPHRAAALAWLVACQVALVAGLCTQRGLLDVVDADTVASRLVAGCLLPAAAFALAVSTRRGGAPARSLLHRDLVLGVLAGAVAAALAGLGFLALASSAPVPWPVARGAIPQLDATPAVWPVGARAALIAVHVLLAVAALALLGKVVRSPAATHAGRASYVAAIAIFVLIAGFWTAEAAREAHAVSGPLRTASDGLLLFNAPLALWALIQPAESLASSPAALAWMAATPDPRHSALAHALLIALLLAVRRRRGGAR